MRDCPICNTPGLSISGRTGYCRACYRQDGRGLMYLRDDGGATPVGRAVCVTCGQRKRNAKTCGDPLCLPRNQRTYQLTFIPCPYEYCGQLFQAARAKRTHFRRYCSRTCARLASRKRNARSRTERSRRTAHQNVRYHIAYLYSYRCALCEDLIDLGAPMGSDSALEIDHIIPWADGGLTEVGNLRPLHRRCHRDRPD